MSDTETKTNHIQPKFKICKTVSSTCPNAVQPVFRDEKYCTRIETLLQLFYSNNSYHLNLFLKETPYYCFRFISGCNGQDYFCHKHNVFSVTLTGDKLYTEIEKISDEINEIRIHLRYLQGVASEEEKPIPFSYW